jgi:hypothetical protein
MTIVWHVLIGLIANFLLGYGTKWLKDAASRSIKLEPPTKELEEQWKDLTSGNEGGAYLGYLERLLFFGAFYNEAPVVIAAWLAFKVASKWNAWTNVISPPQAINGIDDLKYLIARRRWGSHVLVTFLVGTLANLIFGYLGAIVICYTYTFFS